MPYTEKAHRTIQAIEHGWNPPGDKFDSLKALGHDKLKEMAHSGVTDAPPKRAPIKARRQHA